MSRTDEVHRIYAGGAVDSSATSVEPIQALPSPSVSPCLRVDSENPAVLGVGEAADLLARRQEELIERELRVLQESGGAVSCRAGCAACCRQLVVVSPLEALAIERHVRTADRARRRRWEEAHVRHSQDLSRRPSLVRRLQAFRTARGYLSPEEGDALEREYRSAQIPCPFLEKERCTIYPARPYACREHFVLTPPELCARDPDAVRMPPTRFEFRAIASQVGEQCLGLEDRLVPLFEALTYAAQQQSAARRTAPLALVARALEAALARVFAWRAALCPNIRVHRRDAEDAEVREKG